MIFKISCKDLAMLVFQVYDKDLMSDELVGQYALPINCIRPGLKAVPLFDSRLQLIPFSMILVNIIFKLDPIK